MLKAFLKKVSDEFDFRLEDITDHEFILKIDDKISIYLKDLDPGIFFYARLLELPNQKREDLLMELGTANYLGQSTGEGIIGLDAEEKFLTFSHEVVYDIPYKEFTELLEDFINFLEFWRQEIQK